MLHLPKSHTNTITHIPQIVTYTLSIGEKRMVHKEEQRYTLVEPGLKYWSCCSWRKGTSWEEVTLISEEI